MSAPRITVSVFALDQLLLPKAAGAKGWAARLSGSAPSLIPGAQPSILCLADGPEGLTLAEAASLSGMDWAQGTKAQVEAVPRHRDLYLLRIGGKPAGLACADRWSGAEGPALDRPDVPEALAAYAAGTLIDTPDGPRAAGSLAAGDVVTTLANGSRPLRWVGRRPVSALEMLAHPGLRPVEFAPGTIGNDRPLVVSPQQRLLIDDWRAAVYFGEDRVLVSAQALVDDEGARLVLPEAGLDYVILLCDRHEVLLAEGALSESFHPGAAGLAGLTAGEQAALATVVPEADLIRRRAAFPIVRNAEARALRLQG
jgi:hypothetical protein